MPVASSPRVKSPNGRILQSLVSQCVDRRTEPAFTAVLLAVPEPVPVGEPQLRAVAAAPSGGFVGEATQAFTGAAETPAGARVTRPAPGSRSPCPSVVTSRVCL